MRKLLAPRAGRAGYPGRHPGGVVEEQVTPGELPAKMRVHTHRVAEPVGDALIAAQTGDGQARSAVDHPVEWRTRPGRGGGGFSSGRTRMCLLGMRLRQYTTHDRRQCDNHPADRQRALRYPIRPRLARPVARQEAARLRSRSRGRRGDSRPLRRAGPAGLPKESRPPRPNRSPRAVHPATDRRRRPRTGSPCRQ